MSTVATDRPSTHPSPTESIELRLFGHMEAVRSNGVSFLPRTRRTRGILAVLALADSKPVTRPVLMDLLWPSRGRPQAQASLRQSIHELRENLAGLGGVSLESVGELLTLQTPADWVDAHFVATTACRATDAPALLSGPLLGELFGLSRNFDNWIIGEREKLSCALAEKIRILLGSSAGSDEIVCLAEAVIAYDPSCEAAWHALAGCYAGQNNTLAVHDLYRRCLAEVRRGAGRLTLDVQAVFAPYLPVGLLDPKQRGDPVDDGDGAPRAPPGSRDSAAGPARLLRIAVAPMRAIGEAMADFATSMEWQILSGLHKFDHFSCTPITATKASDSASGQLATDGFDYLLESFVERWSDRDQFVLRLRDLHRDGEVFWSHRRRGAAAAVFAVQEDAAPVIASLVATEVARRQGVRLKQSPEDTLNFPQLIHKASTSIHAMNRQGLTEADQILSEAIRRDDRHPAPLAWCAYVQLLQLGQGWIREIGGTQRFIGDLIDRSLSLEPEDASVLSIAGHVLAFTQNRLEEGLALQERALEKNPNLPSAWLFSGLAHSYAGEHEEAIRRLRYAKRLSPADQQAYFIDMALGLSHLLNGEPALALNASRNAIRLNPNFSSSYKVALSATGFEQASRPDKTLLRRLLFLEPSLTVEGVVARSPLKRTTDKARLAEGLRLAGLPS